MKIIRRLALGALILIIVAISTLSVAIGYTSSCEAPTAANAQVEAKPGWMMSILYHCYGSPEVLRYSEVEIPAAANDEVLIKVHAASVNPLDWHYMRGSPYFLRLMSGLGTPDEPRLGVDFAGVITAVGSEVDNFQPGDRVFGGWTGAFSEFVSVPANRALTLIPDNVSFEQAAAVPIAAISALQALRDQGELLAGQKVLINGASGGVGTYAVQIAKALGAEVHGVCSTRNVDMVRSIGADHVYDYKQEDYTASGEQYDLIIDNVGNHSPLDNTRVIKPDGRYVEVGGPKGDWIGPMIGSVKRFFTAPFVSQELRGLMARLDAADLALLAELMASGQMRSVIDQRYPLHETAAAIAYSETGRVRGKIVIEVL